MYIHICISASRAFLAGASELCGEFASARPTPLQGVGDARHEGDGNGTLVQTSHVDRQGTHI